MINKQKFFVNLITIVLVIFVTRGAVNIAKNCAK